MRVKRIVGDKHFRHILKLSRRLCGRVDILAGDEHVDHAAEFERRGESARGRIVQLSARDLRQKKGRHRQITPASS